MYYSQFQQDKFLNENIFKNYKDGFFVDIGAYDGFTQGSNSLFFEELGWDGICIEPNPSLYSKLIKNRKCKCLDCAISDSQGEAEFLYIKEGLNRPDTLGGLTQNWKKEDINKLISDFKLYEDEKLYEYINVKTELFRNIIDRRIIQYMSLDVEGNELKILNTIDFNYFDIRVMTIENNFFDNKIFDFFKDKSYTRVANLGCDEVYVKNTLIV
jgi:FkbM family methyltransferase